MGDAAQLRRAGVVVVGSVNRDLTARLARFPAPGETVFGTDLASGLGGKGANQAVASARTGVPTRLLATVGSDDAGAVLLEELASMGVDVSLVAVDDDRPSGLALILVDERGENQIVVVSGANAATSPERVAAAAGIGALASAAVVVAQAELPVATIATVVEVAVAAGARSVVNLAPFVPLPADVLGRVGVLVVNETEAAQLLGREPISGIEDALDAVAELCDLVPAAVVTLGAAGAVHLDRGGVPAHVPAFAVKAVDTTGAGDAFVGVLAAALASGATLAAAVADAILAASRSVEREGAARSYPEFTLTVR
jgi:ribokinase